MIKIEHPHQDNVSYEGEPDFPMSRGAGSPPAVQLGERVDYVSYLMRVNSLVTRKMPYGPKYSNVYGRVWEPVNPVEEDLKWTGLVAGVRVLSNGYMDEYSFVSTHRFFAMLVYSDLRSKPHWVLPEHASPAAD